LATLIRPSQPPRVKKANDILSAEGKRQFFVVHGGLFSKDEVTLDDIRKIPRVGKQPGQQGLMCWFILLSLLVHFTKFFSSSQAR
jgi:serine/threonine-protein phosphatase 5